MTHAVVKGYGTWRIVTAFWEGWERSGLDKLLAELHKLGQLTKKHGNSTLTTVCNELCCQLKACMLLKSGRFNQKCDVHCVSENV